MEELKGMFGSTIKLTSELEFAVSGELVGIELNENGEMVTDSDIKEYTDNKNIDFPEGTLIRDLPLNEIYPNNYE